jgi:hypothetical protein
MFYVEWIKSEFNRTGKKQKDLAKHLGVAHPQVSRLLSGKRLLKANEIEKVAEFFGGQAPAWIGRGAVVRVVGHVSQGSSVHFYDRSDPSPAFAAAPPGSTKSTVALEIQGSGLGSALRGFLVYYDERQEPMNDQLLRKLCVAGLADGRVVVRTIMQGSKPGHFHLLSDTEGLEEDIEITWASPVTAMLPKDR